MLKCMEPMPTLVIYIPFIDCKLPPLEAMTDSMQHATLTHIHFILSCVIKELMKILSPPTAATTYESLTLADSIAYTWYVPKS